MERSELENIDYDTIATEEVNSDDLITTLGEETMNTSSTSEKEILIKQRTIDIEGKASGKRTKENVTKHGMYSLPSIFTMEYLVNFLFFEIGNFVHN